MGIKMKERIYVCHTYYHVYVTFLKELKLGPEQRGKATLLLSKMLYTHPHKMLHLNTNIQYVVM